MDFPSAGYIKVKTRGGYVTITSNAFQALLDNSPLYNDKKYLNAFETGEINFTDLKDIAKKAHVPYPLFFATDSFVEQQIKTKQRKLFGAISKDSFQINSRNQIDIRDVELIVRDLKQKQTLLKKHDKSLTKNEISGLLKKSSHSSTQSAELIMQSINLSHNEIYECKSKTRALELLIDKLEHKQIFVSQNTYPQCMPQPIKKPLSGMTIKDTKIPFIFLAGNKDSDNQEPEGRRIFTLTLLLVLIARGTFSTVTWDGDTISNNNYPLEYDIVGDILMPAEHMKAIQFTQLDTVKEASKKFKVTPSAVTIRAMRLNLINREIAKRYLQQLKDEAKQNEQKNRGHYVAVKSIRKYAGHEYTRRMIKLLDSGKITQGDFIRVACLNALKPNQLNDLRAASL